MTREERGFIRRRAKTMAVVYLTRDPRLRLRVGPPDSGIDIVASIDKGTMFGVQVTGIDGTYTGQRIARRPVRDASMPVCAWLFTMDDDRGYYRWIHKPIVTDDEPVLSTEGRGRWMPLERPELAELIAVVEQWYDARQAVAA